MRQGIDLVEAALVARDFARADRLLEDWLAETPTDPWAHYARSQRFAAEGKHDLAFEAAETALSHAPSLPVFKVVLAERHLALGRPHAAEELVHEALAEEPEMPRALGVACRVERALQDDVRLADAATRFLAVAPQLAFPHLMLAGVALRARDFPEAEACARRALSLEPENWECHFLFAHAVLQRNRPQEALEAVLRAQALAPTNAQVRGLVKKATAMARTNRHLDMLSAALCRWGIGPALALVVVLFAVFSTLRVLTGPVLPDWSDRVFVWGLIVPAGLLFVAVEHHLSRAKPDPKTIRIDPNY